MDLQVLHRQLLDEIEGMRRLVPGADLRRPAVSAWSVGEHLSHLAIIDAVVVPRLLGPSPADPALQPADAAALAIIAAGTLPRGRVRTPAAGQPGRTDAAGLQSALESAASHVRALEPHLLAFDADASLLRHPVFGGLNRRQWLQVMVIHHGHHLAIIDDIHSRATPGG